MTVRETYAATNAEAVTAADSDLVHGPCRAVYVGGDGNLAVQMVSGATVTFSGVVAGTILPIQCIQIRNTNTTATNIVVLR